LPNPTELAEEIFEMVAFVEPLFVKRKRPFPVATHTSPVSPKTGLGAPLPAKLFTILKFAPESVLK
jgi:hypothetical protein